MGRAPVAQPRRHSTRVDGGAAAVSILCHCKVTAARSGTSGRHEDSRGSMPARQMKAAGSLSASSSSLGLCLGNSEFSVACGSTHMGWRAAAAEPPQVPWACLQQALQQFDGLASAVPALCPPGSPRCCCSHYCRWCRPPAAAPAARGCSSGSACRWPPACPACGAGLPAAGAARRR